MCLVSSFFPALLLYFLILLFSTISKKTLGYRSIFFLFTSSLSGFFFYLISVLDSFVLFSSSTFFNWNLTSVDWLPLDVVISLKVDFLSYMFILLVVVIGLATNFYTSNYLKHEAVEDTFILLINWFIFSMIILVLGNNLFTLFLGWESIGLSSFFLINFWSTKRGTVKSSFKAFFFNKLSDAFLLIFLIIINYTTSLNDLTTIVNKLVLNPYNNYESYNISMYFLLGCSLFKSAQIFGHLWLPDSMEAPVPASALIHSATLVSAGVYLLLRFTPLVTLSNTNTLIMVIGSLTAAYGGIVSASQTDMKKLLAYSTISHCGFLFVTIGAQIYSATIIYLFMHGLFKASTFFCAGSFIRIAGSQDTRKMGALSRVLPVDTIFLIICSFNLGGLPLSFGYLYKGALLSCLLLCSANYLIVGLCFIGMLSSVVYVYRLVYYTAFDTAKEWLVYLAYQLQQKDPNVTSQLSLTTIVQIIAIYIVMSFSIYIYTYFYTIFLKSDLILDCCPLIIQSNFHVLSYINNLYKVYYELFYSVYLLILSIIVIVVFRVEFSFLYRLSFYILFLVFIFFFISYTSILNKVWGHILTEASTQQNFNFGFSTYKSEILVHLSQWQYWWWFWFSIWWTLYYFIIVRVITKRTFNFNVILNTSLRGRGKWGDFLVALIPISWCCNILINSNFILRMIEWQNESSLFTIRVQGKQWYWVYKYDPNTAHAVTNTPKNIGNNRWRVISGQESYNADTYYQAIHLASHLEFQDSYTKFTKKIDTHKKNLSQMALTNEKIFIQTSSILSDYITEDYNELHLNTTTASLTRDTNTENVDTTSEVFSSKLPLFTNVSISYGELSKKSNVHRLYSDSSAKFFANYYSNSESLSLLFYNFFSNNNFNAYYDFIQLDDTNDVDSNSRHFIVTQPFRLLKGILNNHVVDILQDNKFLNNDLNKLLFLNTKFYQSGEALADKELLPETLWGFRQKKYKRSKKYKFKPDYIYDPLTFSIIGQKETFVSPKVDISGLDLYKSSLDDNNKIDSNPVVFKDKITSITDNFNYRVATKINRHRSELVPVTLARRLLRTKRTLVLPAHVNLTVITNSYDVVHSWFIPGLGLKMDCVPGRSTHHTFYIDNIGFYYGQCAEICGRYHHHMPIRLCALPFEHFVVWWQSKGLARMNRTSQINNNKYLKHNFNNPATREKLIFKMN
jgi:NADH:ubiquinone oxidoreductase subunit 5 (subunit L)/multisubunit Na+/H+ antiporter MnhA subunit/heme/copper-type cytochrome/quinol oxidase subunit 2